MFISTAYAQSGAAMGNGWGFFIPMILIFIVFYFLLIRPQQKKQKEHLNKIAAIRRGDKIVTGGGVIGTVSKVIGDTELLVEIAEGIKVRVYRHTVGDVINKTEPVPSPEAPKTESKKNAKDNKS